MVQPCNSTFLFIALLCGEIQAYNPGGSPWAVQASGAATAQSVNLIQDAHLRAAQNETKIPVDVLTPTDFKNSPQVWENFRYAAMGIVLIVILGLAMNSQAAPAVFVVLGWSYASISMSLLNKQATLVFPFTALLIALQMGITDVTLVSAEGRAMTCGKFSDFVKWSVVPFFYTSVLASGIWALKVTTVSTVLILRNVLPLFTLVGEKLILNKSNPITLNVVLSMLVVVFGSVLYAWQNVSVSRHAIGFVMLNCVLVVLDRLVQRSLLASPDFSLSPAFCMLVNNTVGIFLMALLAICNSEMWQWPQAMSTADATVWFWIVLTGINGCCLGYLGIRTQKLVSATSFLMLQNANKVVLILLSVAIFGDALSGVPLAGCILSMLGSLWYGVLCLPKEAAAHEEAAKETKV